MSDSFSMHVFKAGLRGQMDSKGSDGVKCRKWMKARLKLVISMQPPSSFI